MRKRLVFVSTRFLFPVDSGGKIRTTQILRGMKGGEYEITLLSPATPDEQIRFAGEIDSVCDRFQAWPAPRRGRAFHYTRLRHIMDTLPISIATDRDRTGRELIRRSLSSRPDVAVFDFLHAAVLAPKQLCMPTVLFTHNVEAEIFERHRDAARNLLMRMLWKNQSRKMHRFEKAALSRFDVVVAVSDRDAEHFKNTVEGLDSIHVIPTGVDLDYFRYEPSIRDDEIVFCGSMDWMANQDAVEWFLDAIWPHIVREVPEASLKVVGRAPPARLVEKASRLGNGCRFTGFVDDVRDHVSGAAVSIIPMRVGGGTRLKAYEALAMGTPMVSTRIGVEGLPLEPGTHYLQADTPRAFAEACVRLMRSPVERRRLAENGRRFVEEGFSHTVAAKAFEEACALAVAKHRETRDGLLPGQPG